MEEERPMQPDAPASIPEDVPIVAPGPAGEPPKERPFALSVVVGLIVALALGAGWAGIAIATEREIGFVAWVVGLGVGVAMAAVAGRRSTRLGVAAVVLSLVGLVAGKVMTAEFGLVSGVVDEILVEPNMMSGLAYQALRQDGKVDEDVQAWWEASEEGDTPPAELADRVSVLEQDIQTWLANTPVEEKRAWAEPYARMFIEAASPMDRYNLSMYDILWVVLAIGAAWSVTAPRTEAVP